MVNAKYFAILIVLLIIPIAAAINCYDLDSENYIRVTAATIGEDYNEETIIIDAETDYKRHIYTDYSIELFDVYYSTSKESRPDLSIYKPILENCISLTFLTYGDEICTDYLPCYSYADLIPGFYINVISENIDVPYYEQLTMITEFNGITEEYQISELLCNNNGNCEGLETYHSCSDCNINAKDNECIKQDDGLCDPDCYYDADCEKYCNDNLKNGNEIYIDFGGSCGYDNLDFCFNGIFDKEVENLIDCGGYCEKECTSGPLSIIQAIQLFKENKINNNNVFSNIFLWLIS